MAVSKENLTPQCGVSIAAVEITHESIFPRQQKDELCNKIREFIQTRPHNDNGHYYMPLKIRVKLFNKGCVAALLPKRKGFMASNKFLPIAPSSIIPAVIQEAHNSQIAGHGGAFRTVEHRFENSQGFHGNLNIF